MEVHGLVGGDGDSDKAIETSRNAIKLHSDLAEAHFNLAPSMRRWTRHWDIRWQLPIEAAERVGPNSVEGHYHLAMDFRKKGAAAASKKERDAFQKLKAAENEEVDAGNLNPGKSELYLALELKPQDTDATTALRILERLQPQAPGSN
jgi:hypothetical protein